MEELLAPARPVRRSTGVKVIKVTITVAPPLYTHRVYERAVENRRASVDVPRVINERFCKASFMNSSKPIARLYLNQEIDLHVFSMQSAFMPEEGLTFKLNVQYYKCGGLIDKPNSGVITSPNFGGGQPYLRNSHCLWMLVAPEGMIVKCLEKDEKKEKKEIIFEAVFVTRDESDLRKFD
ncbi:hypothetical protein RB195_016091 [Necator americanus]|uniref:CUB domain-containing protein n=1 Tax=Necator americanus TaxID=51031 RepID=A0ABR1E7I9_NECAM